MSALGVAGGTRQRRQGPAAGQRGLTSKGVGARVSGVQVLPEQDSYKPHVWLWRIADLQVGSSRAAVRGPHRRRTLQAPTPLRRGDRAKVTACVARVFSGSVSILPPLFAVGHTRPKRGAGDGNSRCVGRSAGAGSAPGRRALARLFPRLEPPRCGPTEF